MLCLHLENLAGTLAKMTAIWYNRNCGGYCNNVLYSLIHISLGIFMLNLIYIFLYITVLNSPRQVFPFIITCTLYLKLLILSCYTNILIYLILIILFLILLSLVSLLQLTRKVVLIIAVFFYHENIRH